MALMSSAARRGRAALDRLRTDASLGALALIAAVGLALRLYVVWLARDVPAPPGREFDSPWYITLGHSWRAGKAPDIWYFPPGYPFFLGLVLAVRDLFGGVGGLRVWVGTIQSVLAAGTAVAIGLLGRRLAPSPRAGRWIGALSALVYSLWPSQVLSAATIMSEGLFTPMLVLGLAVLLWEVDPSPVRLGVAGVIFGHLLVTRYSALPMLAVALGAVALGCGRAPGARHAVGGAARAVACFALPLALYLAPWLALHRHGTGTWVPRDSGEFNLCAGNHEGATGSFDLHEPRCDPARVSYEQMGRDARRWILANLDEQPRLVRVRAGDVFDAGDDHALSAYPSPAGYDLPLDRSTATDLANRWWVPARWLALAGLVVGIPWWGRRLRVMALLTSALLVGPLTTTGTARYHEPLVPFMAICIAGLPVACARAARWARARLP